MVLTCCSSCRYVWCWQVQLLAGKVQLLLSQRLPGTPTAPPLRPSCAPQTLSALLMLLCGGWAEAQLNAGNAGGVTALFFVFVLLAATQDIAVDGWALTLLSKQHVGCAARAAAWEK